MENEIRYIYHLADIHIRTNKRFEEYNEVFKELYRMMEEEHDDGVIVVCGDILHNKSIIGAKQISIARRLFKELGRIMPVIVIAGNHDVNMNKENEEDDALSVATDGIVNVKYCRERGIYKHKNILFGITTIYDNEVVKISKIVGKNKTKVALWHGTLYNTELRNGYKIKKGMKLSDFEEYDYVMLGDIHIDGEIGRNERAAYSGALIQQNFSETMYKHGYIKWDIKRGRSEFMEVKNEVGYLEIKIEDGIREDVDEETKVSMRTKKKINLKIKAKRTTMEEINGEIMKIGKKHKIINKPIIEIEEERINMVESGGELYDPKKMTINKQENIIREYLRTKTKINKETIDKVVNLNKEYYESDKIIIEEGNKGEWIIEELEFKNLLSYGDNKKNIIKFKNKKGILGIIAPNHYGKSAIIDIILFAIYHKYSRASTEANKKGNINEIINMNKKKGYVKIRIRKNGYMYEIEKYIMRKNETQLRGTQGKTQGIEYRRINREGEIEIMNDDDITKTLKEIQKEFGKYGESVRLFFCLQDDKINIIETNSKERMNAISKIMDYEIYDILNEKVKKEINDMSAITRNQKKELDEYNETEVIKELEKMENKKEKMNEKRDEIIYGIQEMNRWIKIILKKKKETGEIDKKIEKKIKGTKERKKNIEKMMNEIDIKIKENEKNEILRYNEKSIYKKEKRYNDDREELEEEIKRINYKIKHVEIGKLNKMEGYITEELKKESEMEKLEGKIKKYNKTKEKLNINVKEKEMIKNKLEKYRKIERKLINNENEIMNEEKEIAKKKELIHKLKTHKYDKKCKYCCENEFVKIATDAKKTISKNIERKKSIEEINEELKKSINNKEELIIILQNIEKMIDEEKRIKEIYNKQTILKMEMNNIKEKKMELEKIKLIDRENEKRRKEIIKKYEELNILKKEYNKAKDLNKKIIEEKMNIKEEINKRRETKQELINYLRNEEYTYSKQEEELEKYNKQKDIIILNDEIEIEIRKMEESIEEKEKEKMEYDDEIIEYKSNIKTIKKIMNKMENERREYHKNMNKMNILKLYRNITNREGIPLYMFGKIKQKLEDNINACLSHMQAYKIILEDDKKDIKISIKYNENDAVIPIKNGSGFEKFVGNIAIRMGISNVINIAKPKFFVIDEGWSCLDAENRERIRETLEYLKSKFEYVLMISHMEELKEEMDGQMEIVRENGYSYIEYG